jgi:hypothetical protein
MLDGVLGVVALAYVARMCAVRGVICCGSIIGCVTRQPALRKIYRG